MRWRPDHRQNRERNGFIIIIIIMGYSLSFQVILVTMQINSRVTVWLNESPLRFQRAVDFTIFNVCQSAMLADYIRNAFKIEFTIYGNGWD